MKSESERCVLYATAAEDVHAFARAVIRAGGPWKPVAVPPAVLDAAVQALEPEAVVVASSQPRADAILHRTKERYGDRRVVIDDRNLSALTALLRLSAA